MKMVFQNEKRFWHIVYAYIPIALIGIFFLHIFQTSLQRNIKPKWSILATTCIWTLFFESFIWIDGGLPWDILSIIISMAILASLFLICSFAFYKSDGIVGQVILLGLFMSVYV
ncbi:MAG: hypothetical protein KAV25_03745 [Methanophagales archaeon]|nr:hypothetical protein [Methanophagales archaeon]